MFSSRIRRKRKKKHHHSGEANGILGIDIDQSIPFLSGRSYELKLTVLDRRRRQEGSLRDRVIVILHGKFGQLGDFGFDGELGGDGNVGVGKCGAEVLEGGFLRRRRFMSSSDNVLGPASSWRRLAASAASGRSASRRRGASALIGNGSSWPAAYVEPSTAAAMTTIVRNFMAR